MSGQCPSRLFPTSTVSTIGCESNKVVDAKVIYGINTAFTFLEMKLYFYFISLEFVEKGSDYREGKFLSVS